MPKVSPIQNSFNAGEMSPLLYGRSDIDRYKQGLSTCENYIPSIQGPLLRRPGTIFVQETKYHDREVKLVPFEVSSDTAFMLEFGHQYVRVFTDGAIVTNGASTITSITSGSPNTITTQAAHGFSDNDRVVIGSLVGREDLNNREFIVATVSATKFTLLDAHTSVAISSVPIGFGYTSGGLVAEVFEVATPYTESQLSKLKYAQSVDVLYLAHPDNSPSKLFHFANNDWSFSNVTFTDGPYLPEIDLKIGNVTPSATSGTITLNTSGIRVDTFSPEYSFPLARNTGRLIRLSQYIAATPTTDSYYAWGWGTILGVSGQQATVALDSVHGLNSTATINNILLGEYGTSLTTGADAVSFPSSVVFHEDRLWWGATSINPLGVHSSNTADYENMQPTDYSGVRQDHNGLAFSLNANDVNRIRWQASDEKGLLLGSSSGPWVLKPSNQNEALTPENVSAKRASSYGTADIQPVQSDKTTLYVQNSGRKIRELTYFYDVDGFRAPDLTVLSEHITKDGLVQLALQKEPQPLLWGVRSDGYLISLAYERDSDGVKAGWAKHRVGGYSDASQTSNAEVESIAAILAADESSSELWMVVKRYINGRVKRSVEYMAPFFDDTLELEDAFFVDSGLTYDSTPTATVSGLNHLEGQIVTVLQDGAYGGEKTVSSGRISLDVSASTVQVGLPYTSKGQMLRLDVGAADGTAFGKTRRMNRVSMMLHNTGGLEIGMDFTNMREVSFFDATMSMDTAIPLYSGIRTFELESDYDFENQFAFRQSKPLPGTIVAVLPQQTTNDR